MKKAFILLLIGFSVTFSVLLGKTEYIANQYFSFEWNAVSFSVLSLGSDEPFVTTAFVGYVFLLLFAGINFGRARNAGVIRLHMAFTLVTFCALALELLGYWQLYNGRDIVVHVRIGLLLAACALWLAHKMYSVFSTELRQQIR